MTIRERLKRRETAEAILASGRSLLVENARLRAALKPFADISGLVEHTPRRDGELVFSLPNPEGLHYTLLRDDFRRAAKAFNS